jgi:glutamine cyclotransferase
MKSRKAIYISMAIILTTIAIISVSLWAGEVENDSANQDSMPVYEYKIINIYPHDSTAYTQGLVYDGKDLYESTGLYGNSTVRRVELETGRIQKIYRMPAKYFGEGMTIWKNQLVQLTWKSMVGFVYNKSNFNQIGVFYYDRDGWGITNDSQRLIMSDGSDTLYFMNPDTFSDEGLIKVKENGKPVYQLNELEFINGKVLANIYLDDRIAIISPETGAITGWIDLQGLSARENNLGKVDVLNGIAYNARRDTLLVTGKFWPELFEIEIQSEDKTGRPMVWGPSSIEGKKLEP